MSEEKNDYLRRLTSEIHEGAKKAESLSSASIYRVPKELRKLNESAYTPRLIAIGPLHQKDPHLQTPMQHVKMSYTNDLLCRVSEVKEGQESAEQKKITVLQECMEAMETSIEDAKKCYAEEVELDKEMMFIDGCCILELLYRLDLYYRIGIDSEPMLRDDPIFVNDSTIFAIQKDLLLLENQIPFSVLEKLYLHTLARIPTVKMELTDFVVVPLVHHLMRPTARNSTNSGSSPTEEQVSSGNAKRYHHIPHKIHDDYLPRDTGKGKLIQTMPCASELVYAGVKFERGTENDLFKVKFIEPKGPFYWFCSARFEIPSGFAVLILR